MMMHLFHRDSQSLTAVLVGLLVATALALSWGSRDALAEPSEQSALVRIASPPLGLQAVPLPPDNPPTAEKIDLGRKLFFDPRLSRTGQISCGTCHLPAQGFAVNGAGTAIGHGGVALRRNAPTILNVAYQQSLFLDGRQTSLEAQALEPFVDPQEMANDSLAGVVQHIQSLEDYDGQFEQAFGEAVNAKRIGQAIASYERSLLAGNSPFDRWHYGGQENAISEAAKQGFELFKGKAGCIACHTIDEHNPLFTDHQFHDAGIGWKRSRQQEQIELEYLLTGANADPSSESRGPRLPSDLGRFEVTRHPEDMFRYRTPSLRNIALTAPYMHDGSLATLRDVVVYYAMGGFRAYGIDILIQPLTLESEEQLALVAFLESLTSDDITALTAEAVQLPPGQFPPAQ